MTAPLNGHTVTETPSAADPAGDVARGLYASQAEDGDPTFDDLAPEQQEDLAEYCRIAIGLHVSWMVERGFRIVPKGATPVPTTQEEALGMVQAAKAFFDAQKRKGRLLDGAVGRKVILPKGTKLQ